MAESEGGRNTSVLQDGWNESFLLAMTFTGHILRAAFEDFVGVPTSRLALLVALYAGGELSQADLQRHLEVDGATITRTVKQMEAEALLRRWPDPKDNRFTLVALTEQGRASVEALIGRFREFERLAVQGIERGQIDAAVELLARMRANMQSMAGRGCPARGIAVE